MSATSNKQILDLYIKHQTYLLRYSSGLAARGYEFLYQTEDSLENVINKFVLQMGDINPLSDKARKKYKQLLSLVKDIRADAWDEAIALILLELKEFVKVEAEVAEATVSNSLPVVVTFDDIPAPILTGIVTDIPYEGFSVLEWLRNEKASDAIRITKAVKTGLINGTPLNQIVRSVVGSPLGDSTMRKSKSNLEKIIRTVANGIASQARNEFYKENSDLIKQELFVATLDRGTTPICAKTDGELFDVGTGLIPPLHFACRSIRVPYINPANLLNRPFDSSTEKMVLREFANKEKLRNIKTLDDLPYGYKQRYNNFARKRKRELVGQVPAQLTFSEWLKRQTVEFQNEYLGIRRGKMFRDGNLPLSAFVSRDGDFYTLKELREKGMDVPSLAA